MQVPSMLVGNVLLPLNLTLSFVKKKATKPVLYWHPRGGYEAGRKAIRLPSLQGRFIACNQHEVWLAWTD